MPLEREKCCHVPIPFSIFGILRKNEAEVMAYFNYQLSEKASPIRVKTRVGKGGLNVSPARILND